MINNNFFYLFYEFSKIPYIAKIAIFLSYPFTYGLLAVLAVWAIFISKRKFFNTSFLFLSAFISWVLAFVIKNILQIRRPFIDLNIMPLYQETGFSFPSEHMAVFTAIAVSMFFINKKAGLVFFIIAILIGLSRIVIGVHYPIDIIGGFIIGIIISLILKKIFKKYEYITYNNN